MLFKFFLSWFAIWLLFLFPNILNDTDWFLIACDTSTLLIQNWIERKKDRQKNHHDRDPRCFLKKSDEDHLIKLAFNRGIKIAIDAKTEQALRVIGLKTFDLEIQAPGAHFNDPNIARFRVD